MTWIYLSPHLDDVVLSCGAWIWQQVQSGELVEIWTICAGDPPAGPLTPFAAELHARWQTGPQAAAERRAEDCTACACLGAAARHFDLPDCIYRRLPDGSAVIGGEADLFAALHPAEAPVAAEWAVQLRRLVPAGAQVVCPLTLGGHRDHRLVRAAAEQSGLRLAYYADYPYAVRPEVNLSAYVRPEWVVEPHPASPAGLAAWQDAVAAYRSQISTFWAGEAAMRAALADYCAQGGGQMLWRA